MNQKTIGLFVLIIGIILVIGVHTSKLREDKLISVLIEGQGGTCFLEDGTCLHADRDWTPFIIGYILSASLLILGLYLIFFDRTQSLLAKQHKEVSESLAKAKKKDEFSAFLSGFEQEEQKVLRAIYEQEGIKQSTLRYRADMSKTSLSLILKSLEERNIIARKVSGKTKEVFLKKKF